MLRRLFMKKGKFLVLGLIALMLAGGLALASCGSKCPGIFGDGKGECSISADSKSVTNCTDGCVVGKSAGFKCDC